MEIKFKYDIGDYHILRKRDIQSNVSVEDIKIMYEKVLGIPYHEPFSSYEIIKEGD